MSLQRAKDALCFLDAGCDRDTWHEIGRAAISAGLSIDDIDAWSASAENYKGTKDVKSAFRAITPEGGTGPGTLFRLAKDAGWQDPGMGQPLTLVTPVHKSGPPPRQPAPGFNAALAFDRFVAATNKHGYIASKQATGAPLDGLRVVPATDPLHITKKSMAGYLAVPAYAPNGQIQSIQLSLIHI